MKQTILQPGEELILRRRPYYNLRPSRRCNGYSERVDLVAEEGSLARVFLHYPLRSIDQIKARALWRVTPLPRKPADRTPEAAAHHFRCESILGKGKLPVAAVTMVLNSAGQIVWCKATGRRQYPGRGQQGRPSPARMGL